MTLLRRLSRSPASRTAAASYLAFFSTAAFGLVSIPIAVAFLENEQLGLWTVIHAFLGYLVWMDMGVGTATGRLMAKSVADRDQQEINRWWTLTRIVLCGQCIVIIAASFLLAPALISILSVPAHLVGDARWLILGGAIITGLGMPMRGIPGLLTAQNRFYWIPVYQTIVPWIQLGAFYLMLRAGHGMKSYIFAMAISQAVNWVLYQVTVIAGPDRPRLDFSGVQRSRCKKLLGFSSNVTVMGLVETLMQTLPAILIARLGGLAIVPIFNFSWKVPFLAAGLGKRTYQSFYPSLQRLHVSGKHDAFRAKHRQVGLLSIGISLLIASGVLLVNSSIVQLLTGPDLYIGPLANMWFAIGMVSITLAGIFRILLPISGNYGKNALVSVLKLAVSTLLAWLAWQVFGLTGVAAVFALAPLITGVYCYLRGTRNCGYTLRELSPSVAILGIASIILVAIAGLLVAATMSEGIAIELGKRTIITPGLTPAIISLIPVVPGLYFVGTFARNFIRGK